jgi:N-hydroxyarylamine O-acetyltransferase
MMKSALPEAIVERVLGRLGFSRAPDPTLQGLGAIYGAWCRTVPFDNIRKLIHVRSVDPTRLPGDDPAEFFDAWLRHGTGATCWAGNGALCELLRAVGSRAERAVATMMVAPNLPPNHGSVAVDLDGASYLVDASMLYVTPLPMRPGEIRHPAWGVAARVEDGCFTVRWNALQREQALDCRVNRIGATVEEFRAFHEATRTWSPFNFELHLRVVRGECLIGAALGQKLHIGADGTARREPISGHERVRFLVEEAGISEEMATRVPPDMETPPPPSSKSASPPASSRGAQREPR